ncbi:MAG: c-type cytochrome [Gammaproteobacteria bacterium]|nr:c-type cytochrome [Gammaproteobacteria bacterium]
MKRSEAVLSLLGLALVMGVIPRSSALPWDEDMRNQPSIKPQESLVETNASSVPTKNKETIPTPKDIGELVLARLSAGELQNPVRATPESLDLGKSLYEIHCQTCHGGQGRGDGPVGLKFAVAPMDLTMDYVQLQPDGQIFFTISHGSIAMPFYRDSIPEDDRWHVVNYIKHELGKK